MPGKSRKQQKTHVRVYDYGARFYDPHLARFMTVDRFAEKYTSLSPYNYCANNPIGNIDINGDSIWTIFKDKDGKILNEIPWQVRKMFAEEFGYYVEYNSETNMLYSVGDDFPTDLSQSESARKILGKVLGKENGKGKLVFGANLRDEVTGNLVDEGSWTSGIAHVDYGDYDDKTDQSKMFEYKGVPTRSHNLARAFEEEYLGHNYLRLGGFGDGGTYTLGKVNKQANIYMKERELPQRLNYGDSYTPIFFGDPDKTNSQMLKRMVNETITPIIHLKRK